MRRESLSILKACSYIFYLIWASGSHVTWNSAVPDPNVWCCILLFLCTLAWAFSFLPLDLLDRPSQPSQIWCRWGSGSIARLLSVIKCRWKWSKVWRIQFTKESFPRLGEIHEWHTNQTLENSNSRMKKKDILCFCFQSKQKQKERINKYIV